MEGFDQLAPDDWKAVVSRIDNLRMMEFERNRSKGSSRWKIGKPAGVLRREGVARDGRARARPSRRNREGHQGQGGQAPGPPSAKVILRRPSHDPTWCEAPTDEWIVAVAITPHRGARRINAIVRTAARQGRGDVTGLCRRHNVAPRRAQDVTVCAAPGMSADRGGATCALLSHQSGAAAGSRVDRLRVLRRKRRDVRSISGRDRRTTSRRASLRCRKPP